MHDLIPALFYSTGEQCPTLPAPLNGMKMDSCGNQTGDACKFDCNTGYILNGSRTRSCTPSNTWSGLITTCRPSCWLRRRMAPSCLFATTSSPLPAPSCVTLGLSCRGDLVVRHARWTVVTIQCGLKHPHALVSKYAVASAIWNLTMWFSDNKFIQQLPRLVTHDCHYTR